MERFDRAFEILRVHEGGYVNHPDDPGGATMKGITQRTYNAYRKRVGKPTASVRDITDYEVERIYKSQYWASIHADDLPDGVAYCVFDAAVNSGPGRAARWLQDIVGVKVDGIVGNETVAAVKGVPADEIINTYCDNRLAFMRSLAHWKTFGDGWKRRVAEVRAQSLEWAIRDDVVTETHTSPQPKAEGKRSMVASAKKFVKDKAAATAAGGSLLGGITPLANGDGPVQYALAAVFVIVVLAAIWFLFREHDAQA